MPHVLLLDVDSRNMVLNPGPFFSSEISDPSSTISTNRASGVPRPAPDPGTLRHLAAAAAEDCGALRLAPFNVLAL